jgi:plasmid stability protein
MSLILYKIEPLVRHLPKYGSIVQPIVCADRHIRCKEVLAMPTLHVRNVPEDLYAQLQKIAQTQNRSLSAQVISLLQTAIQSGEVKEAQAHLLAEVRRRRFTYPADAAISDSVTLLQEDRQR